jgi:adenylylsulfate kinase-like enzyme
MIPILWVTGPPGVGKTAVAWEIYVHLQRTGADPAYVDVDQLGMCSPPPESDPDRHRLKERNVAALRRNFAAAGARLLVVSGVVDPVRGPDVDTLGGPPVGVARLRTDPDELRARLQRRNNQLTPQRGSSVQDGGAVEVAEALDRSSFADWCIDTTTLSIDEVTASVLSSIGAWLETESQQANGWSLPNPEPAPVHGELLWVAGPTGVGKSTIGYHAYLDLVRSGGRVAFVDADQLGFCRTAASTPTLQAQNLAALWKNYSNVEARLAVVVGCVATRAEARRYEEALPNTTITWCQLRVDDAELTRRILSRREGGSWAQPGDPLRDRTEAELMAVADQAIATASLLAQNSIGLDVDVDGLDVPNAANHLLRFARWPMENTDKPTHAIE